MTPELVMQTFNILNRESERQRKILFSYYKTEKEKTNTKLKTILCQTHVVSMYAVIKVTSPSST